MSKATHQNTVRLAIIASAAESSPAKVLAAITALGPDDTEAAAVEGAKQAEIKRVNPKNWAHQMSTAAALMVLVFDEDSDMDPDRVAQDCITRAKASSKSTTECKAKGSGNKLVGAVSKMVEEKSKKAALTDIRKAQGSGRGRGPKDPNAKAALVKAVESKIASFDEAHKNGSTKVEAKARELLDALALLKAVEAKADGALVTISVAGEAQAS